MKAQIIFLTTLLVSLSAWSLVDVRNANFTDVIVDVDFPNVSVNPTTRIYNSRSQEKGIFGFGWCSLIETSLNIQDAKTLILKECGAGHEITFRLQKDGNFVSENNPADAIEKKNALYFRMRNQFQQEFSAKGQMTAQYDKNLNGFRMTYDSENRIEKLSFQNGVQARFSYNSDGFVREINSPGIDSLTYLYQKENLMSVTNAQKQVVEYKYDSGRNLNEITYPDRSSKKITYDQANDWVTAIQDSQGCTENIKYTEKKKPFMIYTANVEKTCSGKTMAKDNYEIWRSGSSDHANIQRIVVQSLTEKKEIVFDPKTEKPLMVVRNGTKTQYTYDSRGRVTSVKENDRHIKYQYLANSEFVQKVITQNSSSRIPASIAYQYNKKGNVTAANKKLGENVKFDYDLKGKIVRIIDGKTTLELSYGELDPKPTRITQKGLGTIEFEYDKKGGLMKSKGRSEVQNKIMENYMRYTSLLLPAASVPNFN
jgi:YD repeat-containing protein